MSNAFAKKDIIEMLKLGFSLVCYAVVSCTVLAVVNNFTSKKIAENQIAKANEGMKNVFPDADSFKLCEDLPLNDDSSVSVSDVYYAMKDDEVIGAVCQVEGSTYDKARMIVGLDKSLVLTGVQFLSITDSPGFGSKAKDSSYKLQNGKTFYGQFTGFDSSKGFEAGKTFDAITGATITSNGVANLLSQSVMVLKSVLEGGTSNE